MAKFSTDTLRRSPAETGRGNYRRVKDVRDFLPAITPAAAPTASPAVATVSSTAATAAEATAPLGFGPGFIDVDRTSADL